MNDLKPFKHADEGEGSTHSVCQNRLKKEGGKATCCHCNPHENCGNSVNLPNSKITESQESGGGWGEEFDRLFVYTDFNDQNGIAIDRPWRPTFQLPEREIASIKVFIQFKLDQQRGKMINDIDGKFLEVASLKQASEYYEGDRWEIMKSKWNEIVNYYKTPKELQ